MEWLDDDRILCLGQKGDIMPINNISVDWENECVSLDDLDIDSNLSKEQFLTIREILSRHGRLFRKEKGLTHLVEHRIKTGDARPIHCNPYRVYHKERAIIQVHVDSMLENDIIERSNSPWSSPVVLAPKANGSIRFCVDYRRLNNMAVRDVYPLTVMDDVIEYLEGAHYFSSIELELGF